jgi:hypothetical protein
MAGTATEALNKAGELTKIAEDLEAKLDAKIAAFETKARAAREKFDAETQADRDKVREAKRAAAAKIRDASRAMGDAPTGPIRRPSSPSSAGSRSSLTPEAALTILQDAGAAGINGVEVAQQAGVSAPTARKVVETLIAQGKARSEGERRGKKFYAV